MGRRKGESVMIKGGGALDKVIGRMFGCQRDYLLYLEKMLARKIGGLKS